MATAGDQVFEPEAPRHDDDNDSAIDSESIGTDYTSLASSIARFRNENGRTYHSFKDGKYLLPNDDDEQDRLDLQHHIFALSFEGKLHLAPLDKKRLNRVLDVGTGTGLWALDFADEYPKAHVIGIDLSPIQPKFVPPNCEFVVDDAEAEWAYSDHKKFDFVHMRTMTASIRDWPKLFKQAYDNLNPGGIIEVTDAVFPLGCDDDSCTAETPVIKWSQLLLEAAEKAGAEGDNALRAKQRLIDAGFTNVTERKFKWAINRWPKDRGQKEIGHWNYENLHGSVEGISVAFFTRVLGWTMEELQVFLVDVRKNMKDTSKHAYLPIYSVWGQKPE